MSNYNKCTKCGEYHFTRESCEPEYFVYHENYMGDESKSIRAVNHEDAAVKYAQYYNIQNEYILMNDDIEVKVEKDGVVKYFMVGAEPDIYYSSDEIDKLTESH